MNENNIIEVKDLSVKFETSEYSVEAVKNLHFSVKAGEVLSIVGESGSGKSVTSLSLMRLIEHGGGQITSGAMNFRRRSGEILDLCKANDKTMRAIRGGEISMIFQEPMTSLNPVFTVGTQIAEAISLHQDMSRSSAMAEALRMLELVRIPEAKQVLTRYPHQLSGGMRQRVMIAMALSCKPSLLIADEPTTALDVTIQAQILQLIRSLQEEMNMGVIFITHDMGVVAEISDRVLVMYRGDMVEEGTCEQVFHNPTATYTKNLLSAVPILGSMNGTDYPERFTLIGENESSSEQATNTVQTGADPVLKLEKLTTRFDVETSLFGKVKRRVHAVEEVSLELYPGETLGLVGESGCGKSTIGRSIIGLENPLAGKIMFQGQNLRELDHSTVQSLRRNIQYVFQDPYASLDPRLTVGFSIMEPLLIHKICSKAEALEKVKWLMEKCGLDPAYIHRYPHEFSGGQRQRICIARALAMNPKVIIADESVSALDVSVRAQIVNLLLDLQAELGLAYIFISHDMAVIERVCHRVAVMYLGQIVELGNRRDVFENPQHPYTKRLMSAVPIPDPTRRTMSRNLLTGEIPSPVHSADYVPQIHEYKEFSSGHFVAQSEYSL